MVGRILINLVGLALILLASAAHYQDWGSDFMFEQDIMEIRISYIMNQGAPAGGVSGLLLLMKLGAFNSCIQIPNTSQLPPPSAQVPQAQLISKSFAKELPQPPCKYGEGGFPQSLPIKTIPMEIQKIADSLFLITGSSFILLIVLWSLKSLLSLAAYFRRFNKVSTIADFLSVASLSAFVLAIIVTSLTARKLLTRRTFYNHAAIDVALELGGGTYLLVLVIITQALLSVGGKKKKKKASKIFSMDSVEMGTPSSPPWGRGRGEF